MQNTVTSFINKSQREEATKVLMPLHINMLLESASLQCMAELVKHLYLQGKILGVHGMILLGAPDSLPYDSSG